MAWEWAEWWSGGDSDIGWETSHDPVLMFSHFLFYFLILSSTSCSSLLWAISGFLLFSPAYPWAWISVFLFFSNSVFLTLNLFWCSLFPCPGSLDFIPNPQLSRTAHMCSRPNKPLCYLSYLRYLQVKQLGPPQVSTVSHSRNKTLCKTSIAMWVLVAVHWRELLYQ